MYVKKRRGLLALAAISASVAFAGIGAGGAQATLVSSCTGDSIAGQGSSLQAAAQASWTTKFKTNMNGGCTTGPTVSYTATSSGRCLATWRADGTTPVNTAVHFCGTDDAPTEAQIPNINAGTGASVLSIPVAQAAIAFVVNPPANCTITSATQTTLERAFRLASTWADLGATGAGCTAAVTPVGRADSSGTTYQVKHWFTGVTTTGLTGAGTETWGGPQGTNSYQGTNTVWPGPVTVVKSQSGCLMATPCAGGANSGSGGGDEVKTVGTISGSIGYAALADARSVFASGTYSSLKWIKVQSGLTTVDPSSNGVVSTKGTSNCTTSNGSYRTGGTSGDLPAAATDSWADVYLANAGTGYPLCTLTWDTALTNYSAHWGATTGPSIATSVRDYLHYVVGTLGGQADGLGAESDYQIIPEDVQTKATAGIQLITG